MGYPHALRRIAAKRQFRLRLETGDVRYPENSGTHLLLASISPFDRAAKLAAIPAGASPANRRRSSHCCSYIQQRRGRLIR